MFEVYETLLQVGVMDGKLGILHDYILKLVLLKYE